MGSRLRENVNLLYECFCEVSNNESATGPKIIRKYPENYDNDVELPKFTFPCEFDRTIVHHYSFVLTSMKSKYTYCFCRYDPKNNSCYVVMSQLPWHEIFYKWLNTAAALQSASDMEFLKFLIACRVRPPAPGETLNIEYNAGQSAFSCECPNENQLPAIPGNVNLTEYFSAVDASGMAGLWAALLYERRVVVVASKPSRLSATVQAANATLYPLSWQHIFIPILPGHLVDYLSAPMPFLIGVPRAVMNNVKLAEIGDVVILDVDKNDLKTSFNDLDTLPSEVVSTLKKELSDKNALGDAVSRAFVRALVFLIGGYRDAIRIETGELITFNREAFVKTRRNMEQFLQKILESQNFNQFIQERLDLLNSGRGFSDEFEIECYNYAERTSGGSGQNMKQQYKDWLKTMKKGGGAVLKSVKDKANPAVRSAVLTVRQGGRNVKSAMQGFKMKLPQKHRSRTSMTNTEDSRLSGTPAAASSTESLRSAASSRSAASAQAPSPAGLPLDLLDELQQHPAFPDHGGPITLLPTRNSLSSRSSATLPPRLPARPSVPGRYPIIATANLLEATDAPKPPPRAGYIASGASTFYSRLTKTSEAPPAGSIHFKQVNPESKSRSEAERTTSAWKVESRPPLRNSDSTAAATDVKNRLIVTKPEYHPVMVNSGYSALNVGLGPALNNVHNQLMQPKVPPRYPAQIVAAPQSAPPPPIPLNAPSALLTDINKNIQTQEAIESDCDLIQLDVAGGGSGGGGGGGEHSLCSLEEFDPLRITSSHTAQANDKDLLREYGLDFSQFGFNDSSTNLFGDCSPNVPPDSSAGGATQPKPSAQHEWTKFN